ncbi:MAG: phospholipid transport system substrate-binding protein [Alteromonadaceae bacterium]|jgi:phospholipid transport system substrate-binding protein
MESKVMFNKIATTVALVWVLLSMVFSANADHAEDPYKLIQRVADATFKRIVDDQQKINDDPNHLKTVVREELMPYINYKLTAKIVLGKSKASSEEKQAFYEAFNEYLITTYATVFTKYNDQKVVFEAPRDIKGKKVVTVKTRIVDGARPDIHIDFKVRLNKKTGQWRAYDMVAEGISLLNTKKAELKGLLRQKNGVTNVTRLLTEKAKVAIKKGSKKDSKKTVTASE